MLSLERGSESELQSTKASSVARFAGLSPTTRLFAAG